MNAGLAVDKGENRAESIRSRASRELRVSIPPIARASWTVEAIHETTLILKEMLELQSRTCLRAITAVDSVSGDAFGKLLATRSGSLFPFPRIDEFMEEVYVPFKERNRTLLSGEDRKELLKAVDAASRYGEILRTYSLLLREGPLVFLRYTAERSRTLLDKVSSGAVEDDEEARWERAKVQGQNALYFNNHDWFSREIFDPMARDTGRFHKFSPRELRGRLFADGLAEELDSALRFASVIGMRGVLGGGHFDTRLSRLAKVPGIDAKTQKTFVVCADKHTASMVRAYVGSMSIERKPTIINAAAEVKIHLPESVLFCSKTNVIFFGVGAQALAIPTALVESCAAKNQPRLNYLIYANSPDAWTLREKLGLFPNHP